VLAEMVKSGSLPPVEERLPKNPMVIQPLEEVGKYGGTWQRTEHHVWYLSTRIDGEPPLLYQPDGKNLEPNVFESYEVSEDGTTYTFHLREGMRWSDGELFSADDILFWYEDVLLNEEIPGGEPGVVEKVDDYTVRLKFAVPYGVLLEYMGNNDGAKLVYHAKHYLSQFHISYRDADELAALVKERGFEQWYQLFSAQVDFARNPDMPVLFPWKITSRDWTTTAIAERNPYYWKVDTEGNQLPYLDKIVWDIIETVDMLPMKIVSGQVDHIAMNTGISNYSLYMENRESGGYRVDVWNYGTSATAMQANQTRRVDEGDAIGQEVAELLRNRDFCAAISKGIDRDDLNQLIYMGLSDPVLTLFPESVRSMEGIAELYEYDLDEANSRLDALGLDQRDGEGMRLLPSGSNLNLIMIGHVSYAIHRDVAEVCTEFMREIGLRATMDWIPNETWWPRVREGDFDIVAYETDYTSPNAYWLVNPRSFVPVSSSTYWAPLWGTYYETGGLQGVEPESDDAKELIALYEQALVTIDPAARQAVMDDAFGILARNFWPIHTLASRPEPSIVKNGFRNVPTEGLMAVAVLGERTTKPEQFFKE